MPTIPVRPTIGLLPALALFYGGMILLVRAWLVLRRHVLTTGSSVGAVAAVIVVWAIPFLLGPPLGSRDVYAYAAQGQAAEAGIDVYTDGPAALGDAPILDVMDPLYLDAPVVYGPLFVALSSEVSSRTTDAVGSVMVFRFLAVLGLVVTGFALIDLTRGLGRDPVDALVLGMANPLVLLHLVSGAHNEAIMLAFLVGGMAIGRRARWRWLGITLCALAAAIKVPAILGVAFLAWPWVVATADRRRSTVRFVVAGAWAIAVIALAGQLTGWGWGWVDAMVAADPVDAYLSVTRVAGGAVSMATGLDAAGVLTVARLIGLVAAAAITAGLLFLGRQSAPTALGWSLLIVAVLHPTTQPWYLTWGLVLMAASSAGSRNRAFIAASAFSAFVVLPVGPQLALVLLEDSGAVSILLAVAALAILTFSPAPVVSRRRSADLEHGTVTVIVPTRNESPNIAPVVERVHGALADQLMLGDDRLEILFVDDSDDETPSVIRATPGATLFHRAIDERWGGLAGAVVDGFDVARGATIVVMDGDLQHPPEAIPDLLEAIRAGADLVVASRRIPGGVDVGLSPMRARLSGLAAGLGRTVFPQRVGRVRDPLSGFFAVRLDRLDLGRLHPDGFKILVEILATHPSVEVDEVPFRFDRRAEGVSKASALQGARYGGHLIDLRLRTSRPWAGAVTTQRVFRSAS